MEPTQTRRRLAKLLAALLAAALFIVILVVPFVSWVSNVYGGDVSASSPTATPTPSATPTPTETAEDCAPEFTQVALDRQGSPKLNPNFEAEVATVVASGIEDPYRAALLVTSGHHADLLAAYAHQVGLLDDANQWASFVEDGCLSQEGQSLYNKLDGAYHIAGMTFSLGEAPANGTNSGVDANGTYGVDSSNGIRGDRTAIEITLPDGSKTWIMLRCGNPVFQARPDLPTVPTDNPPVETPPTPPQLDSKIPSEGSGARGNANTGTGTSVTPGPGTYVPPVEMEQPPATPYVAPAPPAPVVPEPAPVTTTNPTPAPAPTPDPAPAPAPQPSAPPATDPVTECIPIAGIEDCS